MRGRSFAGRNERHKRSPVIPDSEHTENKCYRHRDERDGKEVPPLHRHRDQRIDRTCQHRARDELLRRPNYFRRHSGKEIDKYPAGGGGYEPDNDGSEDP